ncbi:MAG: hypothetical protein Q4D04_12045, partial [Clostridia bacterium]|nr:hypothetical protein [Clostridia bacterium]
FINPVVYDAHGNGEGNTATMLTGDHKGSAPDYTAVCVGNGQSNQIALSENCNTLNCMHDQQAIVTPGMPPRKYIIRRLLPCECCRLQAYPEGWTENLETEQPTDEDIEWWTRVFLAAQRAKGEKARPRGRNAIIRWLKNPQSDYAEYRAYGNSVCVNCVHFVLAGIAWAENGEAEHTEEINRAVNQPASQTKRNNIEGR